MTHQNYLNVLEEVLTWDLSDAALADAICNQVQQFRSQYEEDAWVRDAGDTLTFRH